MRRCSRHACACTTCKDAVRGASLAPLLMTPQSSRLTIPQGATLTRCLLLYLLAYCCTLCKLHCYLHIDSDNVCLALLTDALLSVLKFLTPDCFWTAVLIAVRTSSGPLAVLAVAVWHGSTVHTLWLCTNPYSVLLQAQSSPAHTMDRFLPQKLQEAAAAATAAKARAAGTAAKPEPQQAKFVAAKADKNKERAAGPPSRPSPVASPTKPFKEPIATAPVSRPYITPMPAGIKPRRAILQQDEGANGIMGQVLSKGNNPTPGIIDEFGQVEQGMEFLNMDAPLPDDLDAPSSFCCPITTVSAQGSFCSCCTSGLLASSDTGNSQMLSASQGDVVLLTQLCLVCWLFVPLCVWCLMAQCATFQATPQNLNCLCRNCLLAAIPLFVR